jgi:glycosyltransferase involved in cell wall biosynthesis
MITHSFYESDNRVLRYAETLAARGDSVEIIALRRKPGMPVEETINGVKLYRIKDRFGKKEKSKASFLWPLLRFLFASSRFLNRLNRRRRFDLIHVHNIPDFLVFAAWWPKLRGTKVILDIHDIVPEFFGSKFASTRGSLLVWGLKVAEKFSAAMADHVILANHLWLEKYTSRSARKEKCSVFINHVDELVFFKRPRTRKDSRPVIMFPGGLQWHQGLDIAIRAFGKLHRAMPEAEFHIYGDGNMKAELVALTAELGLNDSVKFFNPMPIKQIAEVMAQADLGVVPKRADSFGNEAYSTKIMEFMSLGVPMVVSSTKIDRYYFDDRVVRFFESGNVDALAEAMQEVLSNAGLRDKMTKQALDYVSRNSWESHKGKYLELVDGLCAKS